MSHEAVVTDTHHLLPEAEGPLSDLITDRALEVVHEMIPPVRPTTDAIVSYAVGAASYDVAAAVLHRLAHVLPGATPKQRAFLTSTAREISPEIADNLNQ
ncbi:hypothetical protein [Streptomyces sp. NPDC088739]|uniref:hypothetical protein n=1 Tax=Streptomyces sp. NPDC088739 TaxID=3365882 RepID=UPI003813ADE8